MIESIRTRRPVGQEDGDGRVSEAGVSRCAMRRFGEMLRHSKLQFTDAAHVPRWEWDATQ